MIYKIKWFDKISDSSYDITNEEQLKTFEMTYKSLIKMHGVENIEIINVKSGNHINDEIDNLIDDIILECKGANTLIKVLELVKIQRKLIRQLATSSDEASKAFNFMMKYDYGLDLTRQEVEILKESVGSEKTWVK